MKNGPEIVITEGAPLARLSKLEELVLSDVPIQDFAFVRSLGELRRLDLARTRFSSVADLEALPHLAYAVLMPNLFDEADPAVARRMRTLDARGGELDLTGRGRLSYDV